MAVSLFVGLMGGAILGYATQKGRFSVCTNHPVVFKSIGFVLALGFILVPILSLTGALTIPATPFYWGGCMACSFIFGFFIMNCSMLQNDLEA
ncbi:hypothetical protein MASR2M66_03450 [Chloroflexota bacterium]